MHVIPISLQYFLIFYVNFGFLIEFQEKTLQNYLKNINNKYDESNCTDVIFTLNKGFVKSALQYVKVHMNNFLEIYKFHWKYDHFIIILVRKIKNIDMGTF